MIPDALRWPVQSDKPRGVWISPTDGWGFMEAIDGELSAPFKAEIVAACTHMGDGILGWRGKVASAGHKYNGMKIEMTPRHTTWSEVVVLRVYDETKLVFSGIANTSGLECKWK